ncbi:sensor histidine kinase [Algoriphagus vanfongensis]|uniref:sensor histidine kinase n=1 Tax=Algoriphagus vanfongensis TaxID=426371 RepID=UPI0004207C42|nr:histidine kinase [Algoriphagus vanfongensis]
MKTTIISFPEKETGKIGRAGGKFGTKAGNFSFFKLVWNFPILFLGIFWTVYFLLDLIITLLLLQLSVEDYSIPLFHWLGGFFMMAMYIGLVLPLFFKQRKRILAMIILTGSGVVFIILKYAITAGYNALGDISVRFIVYEFLRLFQYLFITGLYWKMTQDMEIQKQNLELKFEMETLELERRAMKMSPHFFLNMLTISIHKATQVIPDFWDIYGDLIKLIRYSFKDYDLPNSLEDEVSAVATFFRCQSKRFRSMAVDFQCNVPRELAKSLPFPKLCLLTVIENLFFYGVYSDVDSPAVVCIHLIADISGVNTLFFKVSNQIDTSKIERGHGFGLNALKNIMKSQFGKNFEMKIEEKDLHYSLEMTVCYGNSTITQNRTH